MNYAEVAKAMAYYWSEVKKTKSDYWMGRLFGMEETLELLGIEYETEYDNDLFVTAVIVNGNRVEVEEIA